MRPFAVGLASLAAVVCLAFSLADSRGPHLLAAGLSAALGWLACYSHMLKGDCQRLSALVALASQAGQKRPADDVASASSADRVAQTVLTAALVNEYLRFASAPERTFAVAAGHRPSSQIGAILPAASAGGGAEGLGDAISGPSRTVSTRSGLRADAAPTATAAAPVVVSGGEGGGSGAASPSGGLAGAVAVDPALAAAKQEEERLQQLQRMEEELRELPQWLRQIHRGARLRGGEHGAGGG